MSRRAGPSLVVVAVVGGAIGATVGWWVQAQRAVSTAELRRSAVDLVPRSTSGVEVYFVDRGWSLGRPPWDVGPSRYAQAAFVVPPALGESGILRRVRARALEKGWKPEPDGQRRPPRYERKRMEATLEVEELETAGPAQAVIRVRPRSPSRLAGAFAGFLIGVAALLAVAVATGRRR